MSVDNIKNYTNWELVFSDIVQPSSLQESFDKLLDACREGGHGCTTFLNKVDGSGWLKHVSTLLAQAIVVANLITNAVRRAGKGRGGGETQPRHLVLLTLAHGPTAGDGGLHSRQQWLGQHVLPDLALPNSDGEALPHVERVRPRPRLDAPLVPDAPRLPLTHAVSPSSLCTPIEKEWLSMGHPFSTRHAHFGPTTPLTLEYVFWCGPASEP